MRIAMLAICWTMCLTILHPSHAEDPKPAGSVGVAQIDITPDYPVRLTGYGSRRIESEGVAQRIWAKALAIGSDEQKGPAVLITVENCGITPRIRDAVAAQLKAKAGLAPERLAVSVSHTHTAPCLTDWAPYIFGEDLPPDQQGRVDQYTRELTDKMVQVALEALAKRRRAQLFWAEGRVSFAANRRVRRDGRWTGFGVQADAPVDHSLPILLAKDDQGKLMAVVANYACHCTTLGGNFNQIGGDWVGFAQEEIERDHPGSVALITIGCGADANPEPRGSIEHCRQHGRALADEVNRLLNAELKPLGSRIDCRLLTIDLPFDTLPTRQEWAEKAKQSGAVGYHARKFLQRMDAGEKIPTSFSYPVATWTFAQDLAMVFLGGEVVVDYAIRLKEEFDGRRLWITAYTNDVPCYIASKRVLREGGYEADHSMVYYARPTRLSPSVEDLIVDTVQKLLPAHFYSEAKRRDFPPPKSPEESRQAIKTPLGVDVELVAAEPLVVDPVAFDWGPDGRLWVVEMRDYPNGIGWQRDGDPPGAPGGRIRVLSDTDADGRFDRAQIFLDEIPFPTGVKIWRSGILVTAAPEIFYAEDTDGDGRADQRQTLYRGFGEGNQQHRVNGLVWGLDNWLYVGNGDSDGKIQSIKTGDVVDVSGRDLRIRPDEGWLEVQSGRTQYGRCQDDWGNWFGGNNSNPMWHYVLDDRYLRRNPHFGAPSVTKQVSVQPGAAPVYPISRTLARFNDLDRANRFTSACTPIVFRASSDFDRNIYTYVCEPVHNLVHREILTADGVTFTSRRADDEQQSEFLASDDSWFRPVMVRLGPDGALWIADMYRFVIEHPKWIPKDWQSKLDLRAGDDRGRIYRVRIPGIQDSASHAGAALPRLDQLDTLQLVAALASRNGAKRDMVHQLLFWRKDPAAIEPLRNMVVAQTSGAALHAIYLLESLEALNDDLLAQTIRHGSQSLKRHAIRIAERYVNQSPALAEAYLYQARSYSRQPLDMHVMMQLAYSLGEWHDARAGEALGQLAVKHHDDPYLTAAILSSANRENIAGMLATIVSPGGGRVPDGRLLGQLLSFAAAMNDRQAIHNVLAAIVRPSDGKFTAWRGTALAGLLDGLERRKTSLDKFLDDESSTAVDKFLEQAHKVAGNPAAPETDRLTAIQLLGRRPGRKDQDAELLVRLVAPQNSAQLQSTAITVLGSVGSDAVAQQLLQDWDSHSPTLRAQILDVFLSRSIGTKRLLTAMEEGRLSPSFLDASRRQQLRRHKDASIRQRVEVLFGTPSGSDRAKVLEQYQPALTLASDASRGKTVFEKQCAKCHRLDADGHPVGPDLQALTDKSASSLLVAILDPNRALEDKFLEYIAVTNDGRQHTGMISGETSTSVMLTAPDGKQTVILRNDLEELRSSGKSLMPEGVERDMAPQDIADVIAYVRLFDLPPKQFPGNQPQVVHADEYGSIKLLATNCRIYGPRLVFEQKYRNLGWWVREEDSAVWSLVVPTSGRYRVMLDYACHQDSAGQRFRLTVAGQSVAGQVEGTGTWDDYAQKEIEVLDLPVGSAELVFRSDGKMNTALMDLRGIWLEPLARE